MFGRKQAAIVILNDDLKPEILVERVKYILTSSTLLEAMAQAVSEFAKPEATQNITKEIVKIAKRKAV